MALKPFTSDSMTLEIAKTAALSLADPTSLPVEIISCVFARLEFTPCRVWSATIALLLVRMLDIVSLMTLARWRLLSDRPLGGHACRSDVCNRPAAGRRRHPITDAGG